LFEIHLNTHQVVPIGELLLGVLELLPESDLEVQDFSLDITVVLAKANSVFVVVTQGLDWIFLQKFVENFQGVFKEILGLCEEEGLIRVHNFETDRIGVNNERSALSTEFQSFYIEIETSRCNFSVQLEELGFCLLIQKLEVVLGLIVVHLQTSLVLQISISEKLESLDVFLTLDGVLIGCVKIALVVTTGTGTVFLPVSEAQPAEFESALGTGHVHATLVLLNIGFTSWTGLGVFLLPVIVQGI
jgi:hypothetical protein